MFFSQLSRCAGETARGFHFFIRALSSFSSIGEERRLIEGGSSSASVVAKLAGNKAHFSQVLYRAGYEKNYLNTLFIQVFTRYSGGNQHLLEAYLSDKLPLMGVMKNFIDFCVENKIQPNPGLTLDAFKEHNQHLDKVVKKELSETRWPKRSINLLDFGCGDGSYGKQVAKHLMKTGCVEGVNLFGFDPYAQPGPAITYINGPGVVFDLVIARWVLHHVTQENRWRNFVQFLTPLTKVLIIEHGLLMSADQSTVGTRWDALVNAAFDVVANLGFRPEYVEKSFYVDYFKYPDLLTEMQPACGGCQFKLFQLPTAPAQTVIFSEDCSKLLAS